MDWYLIFVMFSIFHFIFPHFLSFCLLNVPYIFSVLREWAINLCVNTKSFLFVTNRHTNPLTLDKLNTLTPIRPRIAQTNRQNTYTHKERTQLIKNVLYECWMAQITKYAFISINIYFGISSIQHQQCLFAVNVNYQMCIRTNHHMWCQ